MLMDGPEESSKESDCELSELLTHIHVDPTSQLRLGPADRFYGSRHSHPLHGKALSLDPDPHCILHMTVPLWYPCGTKESSIANRLPARPQPAI